MTIEIRLPIIPTAQMRARATVRKGARFASVYKSPEQVKNEAGIMQLLLPYRPEHPITGPVKLTVAAFLPIPQSKSKKWKHAASTGEVLPTGKPDCSNMLKNIEDCMTCLSFWNDDSQICDVIFQKRYGESPRWEIMLDF